MKENFKDDDEARNLLKKEEKDEQEVTRTTLSDGSIFESSQSDEKDSSSKGVQLPSLSQQPSQSSSQHSSTASESYPNKASSSAAIEEERKHFHEQNLEFLEKAHREKIKLAMGIPSPGRIGGNNNNAINNSISGSAVKSFSGFSPQRKSHKRLASIDEKLPPPPPPAMPGHSFFHTRNHSDEVSLLSLGSFLTGNTTNNLSLDKDWEHQERMEAIEQEQKDKFEQNKKNLERTLTNALDDESLYRKDIDKRAFVTEYIDKLEQEREKLFQQWKEEWEEERQLLLERQQFQLQATSHPILKAMICTPCIESITSFLAASEVFIGNLPLTIGAVGLSWVTQGTVWFKFMEEMVDFCHPVYFFSEDCHFPEFPGCFQCDKQQLFYRLALYFHYGCSIVAAICCFLFVLKTVIAFPVVKSELSNPTTSTPAGVVCIAIVCVFAGRGTFGEAIVVATSIFHFILAFWFLYMATTQFGLWPDPGWFPNTVGLTYGAVKTFLYFPTLGLFFLVIAFVFFLSTFFVSVIRVALNPQIAAPVCWIGLSAPSITMYALTLVAQPSQYRETLLEHNKLAFVHNQEWMSTYYLPVQHTMMILSLVGLISAVSALKVRWKSFSRKPFSPAHAAFCFPTLSHTNAIQAYRGAVNAYGHSPINGLFHRALWTYWVIFLVGGTLLNVVFTFKYVIRLPTWTKLSIVGEDEPPDPNDTLVQELLEETEAHELLEQPFVSPAVLQANETGILVRIRRGTEDFRRHGPYMRSRRVSALGFDPTMSEEELRKERARLLDWVARNAPRKRHRTMSNPAAISQIGGVLEGHRYGQYGSLDNYNGRHKRSVTSTATNLPGV